MTEADMQLARAVSVSSDQFAETFTRAQSGSREEIKNFDAFVRSDILTADAIGRGFAIARADNWLGDLCAQCLADRIVTRAFVAEAARQTAEPGLVAAQARINPLSPFRDTLLEANGLIRVADFVCRILVDGAHRGTGFLVRPDIVMTAGHVMTPPMPGNAPLVGAGGAAEPDAADRIEVLFDDKVDIVGGRRRRNKPRRFAVAKDWLVARSAPEIGAGNVANAPVADYALIRLERAPLLQPGGLELADQDPFPADPLLIVQHPDARPMCHAEGNVDKPDRATHFFTHSVNAEGGSSGAPCFSIEFKVVGLHSGEVLNSNPHRNTALSISVPAAVLAGIPINPAPLRYLSKMTLRGGELRVVAGREETQDWIRASVDGSGPQILAVSPTAERKTGMSFTADLIEALLPRDQHRIVRLSAGQFRNHSPQEFARGMLTAAGAAATLALDDTPDPDTTLEAWLRRVFVPAVLDQLEILRDGRMVWLVLDDLRLPLADGNGLRDFLDLLYESVAVRPWFRIVLLGYGATPPPGAAAHFGRIDLPQITPDAIKAAFDSQLATITDAAVVARVLTNFLPLWNFLPQIVPLDKLDFVAKIVAPYVSELP